MRRLIFVLVISSFVVGVAGVYLLSTLITRDVIEEYVLGSVSQYNDAKRHQIEEILDKYYLVGRITADAEHIVEMLQEERFEDLSNALVRVAGVNSSIAHVDILDTGGITVASSIDSKIGVDKSLDGFFLEGRHGLYVKDLHYSSGGIGKPAMGVSMPIYSAEREFLGVILVDVYADEVYGSLKQDIASFVAEVYLVDSAGRIASPTEAVSDEDLFKVAVSEDTNMECDRERAYSRGEAEHYISGGVYTHNEGDEHGHRETVTRQETAAGETHLANHLTVRPTDWCIVSSVDEGEIRAGVGSWAFLVSFGFAAFFILLMGLVGLWLTRSVYVRLDRLREFIAGVTKGDLSSRLGVQKNDELGELVRDVNGMIDSLQELNEQLDDKVKERTSELERSLKALRASDKKIMDLQNEFIFIAAHELRTPVTALAWQIEEFRQSKRDKVTVTREELSDIAANVDRLSVLIHDLLNVARLDYGPKRVNLKEVEVKNVTKHAVEGVKDLAKAKKVKIKVVVDGKAPTSISADEVKLGEVLTNLLSNAIKYNVSGGSVTLRVEKVPEGLAFRVTDTGIGMTAEETKKLFSKFYRVESEETKGIGGTGLGLFIVKRLVKRLGGKIDVRSEKGQGSEFTVTLPENPGDSR